ncbi:MAG: thiamine pyrophosphate-binding protein [Deltaproteobacteria bacterium]|nr:thiamine pyrophosphate-binding protein [Deltaproteobacteria bacterium]
MKTVVGGEIVAEMLAAEGVDTVFGIIDGTYLGFFGAFDKYGIKLITPRHETTAAHMAGAYARLTGKLGVCMASNGPGVANILPGVAVENGEGNRVLLITSSRRQGITYPDRGGAYQYFDQVAVTRPMTKWSGTVPNFDRIPEFMRRAFRLSFAGRPGVVHVDISESLFNGTFEIAENYLTPPATYRRTAPMVAPLSQVEEAAAMLRHAERPLIHAGSGILHAGAYNELRDLANLAQTPIISSWGARAAATDDNPLYMPIYAIDSVKEVRKTADVVLVIGSRLGETDWWGKAPYWGKPGEQKIIQVDIDEEILGMNKPADLAILADAKVFLAELTTALKAKPLPEDVGKTRKTRLADLAEGVEKIRTMRKMMVQMPADPLHSARVPATCREYFADDAVLVADGGNTTVWSNIFHEIRTPNTFLSTHKFGMLGAGVGQALGAKVARPDSPVYCIIGDGAMGFHPQEIETAVRNGLHVTFLVLCDKQWGMVKATQAAGLNKLRKVAGLGESDPINADLGEIAFDDLARSMGAHGERVSAPDELLPALQRCTATPQVSVIHVDVDAKKHMFVPGLEEFKKMHQEPQE